MVPPEQTSAEPVSIPTTVPTPSQLSVQPKSIIVGTKSEQVKVKFIGGLGNTGAWVSSKVIVTLSKSQHSAAQSIALTLFPTTGAVPIAGI